MDLLSPLNNHGIKYKVVSCSHLRELEQEYISNIKDFNLNSGLYKRYISSLNFKIPYSFSEAQSIIIIALPSFRSEACFNYLGREYHLTIPPTYRGYNENAVEMLNIISECLKPNGYKAVKTSLPQKLLAVHSGLAFYGKNNITYVKGLGSFFQLISFYSDMPVQKDQWYDLRMLERCNKCRACVKVCPTSAINTQRFIINAEKCITFFNENGYEFPEWIDSKAHNSLIGCMLCQYNCPENKKVRNIVGYKTEFTEQETRQILNTGMINKLNDEVKTKLTGLDLIDTHTDFTNLKRNLLMLLHIK